MSAHSSDLQALRYLANEMSSDEQRDYEDLLAENQEVQQSYQQMCQLLWTCTPSVWEPVSHAEDSLQKTQQQWNLSAAPRTSQNLWTRWRTVRAIRAGLICLFAGFFLWQWAGQQINPEFHSAAMQEQSTSGESSSVDLASVDSEALIAVTWSHLQQASTQQTVLEMDGTIAEEEEQSLTDTTELLVVEESTAVQVPAWLITALEIQWSEKSEGSLPGDDSGEKESL